MFETRTMYKQFKILSLIVCFILLLPDLISGQENTYPTEQRLFHIERSKNKNLVCYDMNLIDGKLNTKEPLDIYWINREEKPGEKKGLTAIQKRLAYGYKLISQGDDSCEITLSAYPDRKLTIRKHDDKYVCIIVINGQPAILKSLYVKAKPSNSLSVEYVELKGLSFDTGAQVSEKVSK